MTRDQQRKELREAFAEQLKSYEEKRSGEFDATKRREGDVVLGKALQTLSLALRLGIFDYAEYSECMDQIKTRESA